MARAAIDLLRVQVKSVCSGSGPRYTINAGHGNRAKRPYTADQIDLLAAWVAPLDTWYIFPVAALAARVRLHVYPQRPERGGLEDFRERWDLLQTSGTRADACFSTPNE